MPIVNVVGHSMDFANRSLNDQIAYYARVSNPSSQQNTPNRLIDYLILHKHWSPFEMVNICLEIQTTRDIARQMLRHRSFSFQEFSQRYSNINELANDLEVREARLQDTKNRQNSISVNDNELSENWTNMQTAIYNDAMEIYDKAIKLGIAKEQARVVLPEGLTISRLFMNGSVRSWIHYIELRSGPETQKEHREVALACANAIAIVFPKILEFLR